MTLRTLIDNNIIYLEEIDFIESGNLKYTKNLERFLDNEIECIAPYTEDTIVIYVK